ncbi:MAG: hypothetical protein PHX43_05335 [Alphaproteobacteria bacterium]|nr:hypothetical protein [Alphaproteobacteria bacterium]
MSERKLTRGLDDIAPNNSDKAARSRMVKPETEGKKERKKLAPIVKEGGAVKQKPSFFSKFKETFLGEGVNVGEFIVYDVLVPAARNTVRDMGFGIIEMFFGPIRGDYGRNSGRVVRDRGRSYIDYRGASSPRGRDRDESRYLGRGDRARHDFNNVKFDSMREAEDVLIRLGDIIEEYGEVTVANFYELSRLDSSPVDNDYGWTDLRNAYVDRASHGYVIRLPQTRPL